MSFIQHTIKGDKRWDELAVEAYGDPNQIETITEANRTISLSAIVPAGTKINIPIIEQDEVVNPNNVPPWKR